MRNPNVYWDFILLLAFLLFVFYVVTGFLLFKNVNSKISLPADGSSVDASLAPGERVEKTLEYFRERENKSIETINSPSPVIDPSL